MPFPQQVISLTFGGALAGGNETWSCGIHIADPGLASNEALFDEMADEFAPLADLVVDLIANPAVLVPTGATIEFVKAALLNPDGKYAKEPWELVGAFGTGTVTGPYIPQASLVTTLVSDVWKDPGRYNRFYLPISIANFGPGFYQLNADAQIPYANAMVEFVEDVNTFLNGLSAGADASVVVASATRTGLVNPVTSVRIGQVVDTQRRRRNQLIENYYSVDLTA